MGICCVLYMTLRELTMNQAAEIAEAVVKKQVDSRVVENVKTRSMEHSKRLHILYTHVSGPESTRYIFLYIYIYH